MPIKQYIQKTISGVLLLLVMTISSAVHGQSVKDQVKKAQQEAQKKVDALARDAKNFGQGVKTCAQEFPTFLASFFSPENPFSDFYDIFRNQCQIDDIESIQRNIDGIRNQLKSAYIKCNQKDIDPLKEEYAALTYELYFVRNMVDTKNGQYIVKDLDTLIKDAQNIFSDGISVILPSEKVAQLAHQMSAKYTQRVTDYKKCNSFDDFKRIQKRWKSFTTSLKEAGKDVGETVTDTSPYTDPPQSEHLKLNRGPAHAIGSYLGSHMKVNVNPPPRIDISPTFTDLLYGNNRSAGAPPTQSLKSEQQARTARELKIQIDKEVQTMRAKYSILYGDASDTGIQDILKKVDQLNKTIEATYKEVLPQFATCAEVPNSKQCTNRK